MQRGLNNEMQPISVEVYFREARNRDRRLFCIERTWNPNMKEELRIEDKTYEREEFEVYLETLGITYSNPYNIVQQGRITAIAAMNGFELYELLQAAAGCRKYQQRHKEATEELRRNATRKKEVKEMLEELEGIFRTYEARKEQFDLHHYQQLACKLRASQNYQQHLQAATERLSKLRRQERVLADKRSHLRGKAKELREQLEQLNQKIAVSQQQLCGCQPNADDEDLQQPAIASQQLQELNNQLRRVVESKHRLKAEWERKSKETEAAKKEMENYRAKFNALSAQSEGEKLAKTAKGKAQVKATIERLQRNIQETGEDTKKMEAYLKEFKVQSGNKENEEAAALKEKLTTLSLQLKTAKIKIYEQNRVKNQLESEAEVLGQHTSAYQSKLRKTLPLLDLTLLRELRRHKVPGVLGYLLQFVQIDPSMLFAYELAGTDKLCTLLLEQEKVCGQVIEVHRKLKGGQVSMLPLSVVRRQAAEKHSMPSLPDCHSLLNQDWIKIRPHPYGEEFDRLLRKILTNTFGKYLLVQTYENALKISKQYHLHCITADREIVFSGSYFSKVGRQEGHQDRLELYYRLAEKERLAAETQSKLADTYKQLQALQNVELELNKRKAALEADSAVLNRKIDEIAYQRRAVDKVQEQLDNLARKRAGFQGELRRSQELLTAIQAKKVRPVGAKELKEAEQQAEEMARVYNQRGQQQWAVQQQLIQQARKEEALGEQLATLKQQLDFSKSFAAGYVNEREFQQRLKRELAEQQRRANEVERAAMEAEEEARQAQISQQEVLGQSALVDEQVCYFEMLVAEAAEIKLSLQEVEERSHSISNKLTHPPSRRRFFSAKEKIYFSKMDLCRQQLDKCKSEFKELTEAEESLHHMLDECQKEKERQVADLLARFEKEFAAIFQEITGGRVQVRLKVKQVKSSASKFRYSLSLPVSFNQGRQLTESWGEFSGGQKSVLAVSVLMALQRCCPAPFYILDEIDAALDVQYLDRIVGLIRKESQRSQYFISTFKREMLEFPVEICNYYLTEMNNRVSSIRQIGQIDAKEFMDSLSN